ncbi:MAG: mismatch endonuclease Vsr [Gemmatimonadetes bacterium]|nr:mismatch endonuclease Vsr [Gemmatimonadota bacterium]
MMSRIRVANTAPELRIRRWLHAHGYRFRLHRRDLPGTPDIVLPRHRLVVFVHGCFWHRHPGCKRATTPVTRREFWTAKFARNQARDREAQQRLECSGWATLTIWECETKDAEAIERLFRTLLTRDSG